MIQSSSVQFCRIDKPSGDSLKTLCNTLLTKILQKNTKTYSLPNRFLRLQMIVVSMDASNSYKSPRTTEPQNCFLDPKTAAHNLLIESSVSK